MVSRLHPGPSLKRKRGAMPTGLKYHSPFRCESMPDGKANLIAEFGQFPALANPL
ncbi:MAG: hypothetical protein JWN96_707 [Mycobacterium sp.]|nr:hypothetical protein [Mycobacterium sp.]